MSEKIRKNQQPELSTSKHVVILTTILFLVLLIWQTLSASLEHQRYQTQLMNTVSDRIVSDYQEYFNQLRLEIDLFQQKQLNGISRLEQLGKNATNDDYMPLFESFKGTISNSRLFALIDQQGNGILKHITGDFGASCKEEVRSVITAGLQDDLFLHHTKSSVHFDLIQPLVTEQGQGKYFFAAFNTHVLETLLAKYQLPHQQLFLMRVDKAGAIELTTEKDTYKKMVMAASEFESFSFIKSLPKTRWQLAIRLEPEYSSNIFILGLVKALIIWFFMSSILYLFYQAQKRRLIDQNILNSTLKYNDSHDKLTGLVNRKSFDNELALQIEITARQVENDTGVVLHLDLDQFQIINNTYGYAVGDRLLLQLSLSLKSILPENSVLSRLGNDEFAIILPTTKHQDAKKMAHDIRHFIRDIHIAEDDKETYLSACIGVLLLGEEQLLEAEQVLSSLGLCIQLAKKKGGNRVVVYQSSNPQLQEHAQEMDAIHLITDAIKQKKFVLYRQEIKQLSQLSEIKHYELLVRIQGENNTLIYPNDFIPAAEKYGLIKKIDREVIKMAFEHMSKHDLSHDYSINLSGTSLGDRDIFEFMHQMFAQYDVNPKRVCFEITETAAISHLNSALEFIEQMITLGCVFSLDDFGVGLSSFAYLQKLPAKIIKIDGSFVKDIDKNPINRIFVENIQRTAIAMNKKTVAEFVESADIEQVIKEIGIDYGQGYHIDKPSYCFSYQ